MSRDTGHVLDAIDGALLDYTVSGDAMRWTPQPPALGDRIIAPASATGEQLEAFARSASAVAESLRPMIDAFTQACLRVGEQLAAWQAVLDRRAPAAPPAEDPRARALRAVQHRNTGPERAPAGRQKRPRRLT